MSRPLFITGIGTGVGKSLASAVLAEALGADYWKPVQTGALVDSDTAYVAARLSPPRRTHPEVYRLALPASPHIAARAENVRIELDAIVGALPGGSVVVEGAGGLLVPLNDEDFMADLAQRLDARVVLVSRNYLGSINHSLLTASVAKQWGLDVAGWIFNDHFGDYEQEIVQWSGYPLLGRLPFTENPDAAFVRGLAGEWKERLHL